MTVPPCGHDVCYGCMACVDACPRGALSAEVGDDTYLRLVVDGAKCVGCGRCEEVCPRVNSVEGNAPLASCAAIHRDAAVHSRSSSGGAFAAIVEVLVEMDGGRHDVYVCGAAFAEELKVVHGCVRFSELESIRPFSKSKYICSDCRGIYAKVDGLLADSRNVVLFSGTPCQTHALRLSVGPGRENLFIVDFACSGALSQEMFDIYRRWQEQRHSARMTGFTFKNKDRLPNGTVYTRSAKIEYSDGTTEYATRYDDPFLALYYNMKNPIRRSCYSCACQGPARASDMTICDAWGIERKYPVLSPITGVSGIISNTRRGKLVLQRLSAKMNVYPCDHSDLAERNASLRRAGRATEVAADARDRLIGRLKNGEDFQACVVGYYDELGLE